MNNILSLSLFLKKDQDKAITTENQRIWRLFFPSMILKKLFIIHLEIHLDITVYLESEFKARCGYES